MSVAAEPVRLDFDDYVHYTETHADGVFELLDGAIFKLAPEGDAHLRTRSAIDWTLNGTLDLAQYTPWPEASFPAPGWFDGPRPDNFVSRGPGIVDGMICARPQAADIALVIEVSSSTRRKDEARAKLYARLAIPEYWLIDLEGASVVVHRSPGHADPKGYHYASMFALGRNENVTSTAVRDLTFSTSFLLQLAAQH
jgi:Uma2 family endonuclease